MTTLVGTQKDFTSVIKELIELDYDAVEAYKVAIDKLVNSDFKAKMQEFKKDHERHIEELAAVLRKHFEVVPPGPDGKQWLTKGKVFLASAVGDKAILMAMKDNEEDTNTAYIRTYERDDIWNDAEEAIRKGKEDEKRHKETIEQLISSI